MDTDEELLRFLYLCPVGVAEIDDSGTIRMLNALASQLLMPLATEASLDNLFQLLAPFDRELQKKLKAHAGESGEVCSGHRISFHRLDQRGQLVHLDFTVLRLDARRFMVAFNDVTRLVQAEQAARDALEIQSRQAGKLEIASGVLHDIGNAVTGLGARSARLNADTGRPELRQLERFQGFIEQHAAGLDSALGDNKGAAMARFVSELSAALRVRFDDWDDSARLFARTVAHIQEILNIQRTHAGVGSVQLADLALAELLDDVLSIQSGALARRGIAVSRALPPGLPRLRADRTKLVQVLINLVKNAGEAFDDPSAPGAGRRIAIAARRSGDHLEIEIADNGGGFAPEARTELMKRGVSRKPGGTGLGLAGARSLVDLQGGTIQITSPGPGLGATVRITLPFRQESSS